MSSINRHAISIARVESFSIEQERAVVDIFFALGFVICKCK